MPTSARRFVNVSYWALAAGRINSCAIRRRYRLHRHPYQTDNPARPYRWARFQRRAHHHTHPNSHRAAVGARDLGDSNGGLQRWQLLRSRTESQSQQRCSAMMTDCVAGASCDRPFASFSRNLLTPACVAKAAGSTV
jgi:hypothetical protein